MKYSTPELVALGSAIDSVLHHTDKPLSSSDSICVDPATATAYEADE
jgi:hypothetical protein